MIISIERHSQNKNDLTALLLAKRKRDRETEIERRETGENYFRLDSICSLQSFVFAIILFKSVE